MQERNLVLLASSDPLDPIRRTFKAGQRKRAQRSLRALLRRQPSAEAWLLAAESCASSDEAIYCLRRALALQPQHSLARRRLLRLESTPPPPHALRSSRKRRPTRRVLFITLLILALPLSLLTLNLAGLISGPVTAMTEFTGGGSPVREIDGTPISQIENAPLRVQPAQTKPLDHQAADVIEPGYAHDYTFAATAGTDIAIYVQFLSVAAQRVSRNVVVIRPDGSDATPSCDRDAILDGDNGVTYTCSADLGGTWTIRVLGREQESVGAYFIGEEALK